MVTVPKYARLNKDELSKIQALEKAIGKIVLAYETGQASPYAELDDSQIEKIRALEREFGIVLLAYKPNH
jgi:hypothetical protein